jgi:hypothetical protein
MAMGLGLGGAAWGLAAVRRQDVDFDAWSVPLGQDLSFSGLLEVGDRGPRSLRDPIFLEAAAHGEARFVAGPVLR